MPLFQGAIRQTMLSAQLPPLSLGAARLAGQARWCAPDLSLFYICEGSLALCCGGAKATLTAGQLALAGPYRFCQAETDGCLVLWLGLETTEFKKRFSETFARPFRPFLPAGQSTAPLTSLLAQALRLAAEAGQGTPLAREALALHLLSTLTTAFGCELAAAHPATDEKLERIAAELAHCAEHYAQPLSPADAAARCYLSLPYFSKAETVLREAEDKGVSADVLNLLKGEIALLRKEYPECSKTTVTGQEFLPRLATG